MPVKQVVHLVTTDLEAIAAQLDQWCQRYPQMGVMAFLPEKEQSRLSAIQTLFFQRNTPLVGAIFPAIIVEGRFRSDGILLYCFEQMPRYLLQEGLDQEGEVLAQTSGRLAARIAGQLDQADTSTSLFLLFDAMLPHIGGILEELYLELADQVHYMGINAGSESFEPMPCLFDAQHLIQNGLLALLLPAHDGATLAHGYRVPEHLIAATSTEGNRIISIDWRPAFEVYAERVKAQYGVAITTDNFYQYAVHFPFGIIRADSEVLVRIPVALMDDGSLFCVGEIPPNAVLTLLQAPRADSVHTAALLAERLASATQECALLTFYCAGRRLHLGVDAAQKELQSLGTQLDDEPLHGALSLGEIGSSQRGGYPLFHNAALVVSRV
jgi:hypothetical protein